MRYLFDTKKEHKSLKLVKKLQEEADIEWQKEVEKRKEQEERDAAVAKELQEQLEREQSDRTNPFIRPPPLPVKPQAYNPELSSRTDDSIDSSIVPLYGLENAPIKKSYLPYKISSPVLNSSSSLPISFNHGRSNLSPNIPRPENGYNTLNIQEPPTAQTPHTVFSMAGPSTENSRTPYFAPGSMSMPEPVHCVRFYSEPVITHRTMEKTADGEDIGLHEKTAQNGESFLNLKPDQDKRPRSVHSEESGYDFSDMVYVKNNQMMTPENPFADKHAIKVIDPIMTAEEKVRRTYVEKEEVEEESVNRVFPTSILRASQPDYGYYQQELPTLAQSNDDRHITVASLKPGQRVWIRIHPNDTGRMLAERIHIVATYQTRKVLKITTKNGRDIALDNTPLFKDWNEILNFEQGESWTVELAYMDHPYPEKLAKNG